MSGMGGLDPVLSRYPAAAAPSRVAALGGAGGFSGARFWRLETEIGSLCLRRWPPEHPVEERLDFIHAVLSHVHQQGFEKLPLPIPTNDGETYVAVANHLWELAPWISGVGDYCEHPNPAKVKAAMWALAEFHVAAASYPLVGPTLGPSPGVERRVSTLRDWTHGGIEKLAVRIAPDDWPDLEPRSREIVEHFCRAAETVEGQLLTAAQLEVRHQPCIRDIWDEHVLFVGDEVSGLVDFGSLDVDHVSTDIARLLGSMAAEDADAWRTAMAAYEDVRPLSADERRLIAAADRGTVLLSGLNWLKWIYLEGRYFEDRKAIIRRLDAILTRLRCVAS